MSAMRDNLAFEPFHQGHSTASIWSGVETAGQGAFHPSGETDLPFVLVALEEVRVKSGVMQNDVMQTGFDLVEGDAWSLRGISNMTPADTRQEAGQLRIVLSSNVEVGRKSFSVGAPVDLTLMSDCGTVLMCQHIEEQGAASAGKSFLLLPADFDPAKSYELISKSV